MVSKAFRSASWVLRPAVLAAALAFPGAYAQNAAVPDADKLTATLLQPPGWNADWSRESQAGTTEMIFEARDNKVVVRLHNLTLGGSCEHEVTITSDTVKFDGCYQSDITLHFDPSDQRYPFKGKDAGNFDYKLQRK